MTVLGTPYITNILANSQMVENFFYRRELGGTDKTSHKTKRPTGQNVPRDKTSQGHKVPRDKVPGTTRPTGQNVPRKKTSQGKNIQRDKTSQGTKLPPLITKFSITHFVL